MYLRVVGAMRAFCGLNFPGGGASFVKRWSGLRIPFSSLSCSFSSYLAQLLVYFLCLEFQEREGVKREREREEELRK